MERLFEIDEDGDFYDGNPPAWSSISSVCTHKGISHLPTSPPEIYLKAWRCSVCGETTALQLDLRYGSGIPGKERHRLPFEAEINGQRVEVHRLGGSRYAFVDME